MKIEILNVVECRTVTPRREVGGLHFSELIPGPVSRHADVKVGDVVRRLDMDSSEYQQLLLNLS